MRKLQPNALFDQKENGDRIALKINGVRTEGLLYKKENRYNVTEYYLLTYEEYNEQAGK